MPSVKDGVEALYALARMHPDVFEPAEQILGKLKWEPDVVRVRKAMLSRLKSCVPEEATSDGEKVRLRCGVQLPLTGTPATRN